MQLQDASGPSFDPDDALTLVFGAIVVGGNRQRRHAPAWYNAVAVAAAAAAAATEYLPLVRNTAGTTAVGRVVFPTLQAWPRPLAASPNLTRADPHFICRLFVFITPKSRISFCKWTLLARVC